MRRLLFLVAVLSGFPSEAPAAEDATVAVERCSVAVVQEMGGRYGAEGVEMGPVKSQPGASAETRVTGSGQYTTSGGAATKFRWACTYNTRSGDTYALEVSPTEPAKQPAASATDRILVAIDACQRGVIREVHGRLPEVDRVEFVASKLRQPSSAETGVDGQGQYQLRSGEWTKFAYECTFNQRSGECTGSR